MMNALKKLWAQKLEALLAGIAVVILVQGGNALMTLSEGDLDNPGRWARSLVVGLASGIGGVLVGFSRAK